MSTVRWLTDSSSGSSSGTFALGLPPAVQPPPVEPTFLQSCQQDSIRSAVETLDVDDASSPPSIKRSLSSWLTSTVLHAMLLLLLIWILAPLHRLDSQNSVIHVSFANPSTADFGDMKSISVELPSAPQRTTDQVIEEQRESTEQLLKQFTSASNLDFRPSNADSTSTSTNRETDAAKGKSRFFGIDASGDSFVYVVDRSSSMTGRRFYRAVEELIASIESLQPNQSFHVILFAQGRLSMFNQSLVSAQLMPATESNKQEFIRWLRRVGTAGGTIPDSSIELAIKLQPSAIFLLSDGEFTGPGYSRRTPHGGARQTLRLVEQSGRQIPIHTIAFEDPKSCRNLQQIAEITAGSYRFIERPGDMQKQMLRQVDRLLVDTPSRDRGFDLQRLSLEFASQSTDEGRKLFVERICADIEHSLPASDETQAAIKQPFEIEQTLLYLECLVRNDSKRVHSKPMQVRLIDELVSGLNQGDDIKLLERICQHAARWPASPASRYAIEALTDSFRRIESLKCASKCLLDIRRNHGDTKAMDAIQNRFDSLLAGATSRADDLLREGNPLKALEELIQVRQGDDIGAAGVMIDQRIAQLTLDQLCIAKQAQIANNRALRDSITSTLDSLFLSSPMILRQTETKLLQREINARRIMRQAKEILYRRPKDAEKDIRTIIDEYPETITAAHARQMLGVRAPALPVRPSDQAQGKSQNPPNESAEAQPTDETAPISMEELSRLMDDS